MQRARFLERERKLAAEKRRKYRGRASIRLDVLQFPEENNSDDEREPDPSNIKRLKDLFWDAGGPERLNSRNFIAALIDQDQLDEAIRASETSAGKLLDDSLPELDFPAGYQLRCLNGLDRAGAAEKVLFSGDKRWTVELYLADLDPEVKTTITDEYSSEKAPDDGTFYYKIRKYQGVRGESNPDFERLWLARLAAAFPGKRKGFNQLLLARNQRFREKFDKLLFDIPALRGGMMLSTIHKMIGMKSHDEHHSYLDHIYKWYFDVFGPNKKNMRKITRADVKALELKAPGACRADAADLYGKVKEGVILGAFNEQEREAIWKEILHASRHYLIPSLFSFFEDLNYLQVVADCMKRLVKWPPEGTISEALYDIWMHKGAEEANQCVIQESESTFIPRTVSRRDQFDLLRRQAWIAAMRDYLWMPLEPQKKNLLANPTQKDADDEVLCNFATSTYRIGFFSEEIHSLMGLSADREIARKALLRARKPDRYHYPKAVFEENVKTMIRLFFTAQRATAEQANAALEVDISDEPPERCGKPLTRDQKRDRSSLFLDKLHNTNEEVCDEMSSFFVRRSVYFAYFGTLSGDTAMSTTRAQPPDPGPGVVHEGLGREQQTAREQAAPADRDRTARELEQDQIMREPNQALTTEEQDHSQIMQEQAQVERGRVAREKAEQAERDRLAEKQRLAQEQAKQAEQERLAQERLAQEQAKQAEQQRLAQEQAEQQQLAEQQRLAQEQAEQQQLAEQQRLAQEQAEQQQLVEQQRLVQEQAKQAEQQRLAQEQAEQAEQQRLAQEQAKQAEQERLAQEQAKQAKQAEQQRLAQEQAEQAEQQRLAQEQAEQERLAQEQAEKAEQERLAQEQAKQAEQQRLAQEQAEQAEQQRLAQEQAEQQQLAEQQRLVQEQAKQAEQQRLAQEQAEKAEQERLAQEQAKQAEQQRLAQEQAEQAEQQRLAQEQAEQQQLAEQQRLVQEQAKQAEQQRLAQEQAEQERLAQEQAEQAEQQRLAQEQAEQERLAQERLAQEQAEQAEQQRLAQEQAEQERLAQERLTQEQAEQQQLVEQQRLAQEQAEQAEQQRLAQEQAEQERLAQERLAQEQAEQERLAQKRLAEQQRLEEQNRLAQERLAQAEKEPEDDDIYDVSDREREGRRTSREKQVAREQSAPTLARNERPVTQINLEELVSQEQQEQQEQLGQKGEEERDQFEQAAAQVERDRVIQEKIARQQIQREQAARVKSAQEKATRQKTAEEQRNIRAKAAREKALKIKTIRKEQATRAEQERITQEQATREQQEHEQQKEQAIREQQEREQKEREQQEHEQQKEQAIREQVTHKQQEKEKHATRKKDLQKKVAQQKAKREKALQMGTQGEQTTQAERERTTQEQVRQDRITEQQAAQAEQDSEDQQFTTPEKVPGYVEVSIASSKAKGDAVERLVKDDAATAGPLIQGQDPITQEHAEQNRITVEQVAQSEQVEQAKQDQITQERAAQQQITQAQALRVKSIRENAAREKVLQETRKKALDLVATRKKIAAQAEKEQITRAQATRVKSVREKSVRENAARQKILEEKRKKTFEAWATRNDRAAQPEKEQITQEQAAPGTLRDLSTSALTRREERPVTQINLEELVSQEWPKQQEQRGFRETGNIPLVPKGLVAGVREQRERRIQEEKERLERQNRQRKPNEEFEPKGSEGARNKAPLGRILAALPRRRQKPITQVSLENLKDSQSAEPQVQNRRHAEGPDEVDRSRPVPPPSPNSSTTENSNSISNQSQTVEPRATGPPTEQSLDLPKIPIELKTLDRGVWQTKTLLFDPSVPWETKRMVLKQTRNGFRTLNTKLEELTFETFVKKVFADGTNTILLVKNEDVNNLRRSLSANTPILGSNLDGSLKDDREIPLERPTRRPKQKQGD